MTAGCSDPETKREIAVEELAALNEECDQEHTYSSYYHYYLFFKQYISLPGSDSRSRAGL